MPSAPFGPLFIVMGAQLVSLLFFGGALFLTTADATAQPELFMPSGLALSGLAVSALVMGLVLRTFQAGTHALPLLMKEDPSPWDSGLSAEESQKVMVTACKKYQIATIVGCACAEAAALFGFALAMMIKMPIIYLPFAGAAAAVMLWQIPNQRSLNSVARHLADHKKQTA